ncbi:MAG: sortase [Thermomicrobiales bacterium]
MRAVVTMATALLIALAGASTAAPTSALSATNRYYVEDTGHILAEPFLTFWAHRDGKQRLGLPVTEPVSIRDRPAQYFEFGVLRARSTSADDPLIEAMPAGSDLLAARHDPARLVTGRRVGGDRAASNFRSRGEPENNRVHFDETTGHTISGRILGSYEDFGGAEHLGRPLSESYVAGGMRVQWFERGRLQWRLGNDRVALAPVGLELAVARGVATGRVSGDDLALYDPGRFRGYAGDGTIPRAIGPFEPVEIRIPAINIDAKIEQVPIVNGAMAVPRDAWNVGWYPTISTPGEFTNVVLAGHRDWWNIGPVVFYNLERLNPGDKVYLLAEDGAGYTYQVVERWMIDGDTPAGEVVSDTGTETLTLITCGGAFNGAEYENRVIVRAERI